MHVCSIHHLPTYVPYLSIPITYLFVATGTAFTAAPKGPSSRAHSHSDARSKSMFMFLFVHLDTMTAAAAPPTPPGSTPHQSTAQRCRRPRPSPSPFCLCVLDCCTHTIPRAAAKNCTKLHARPPMPISPNPACSPHSAAPPPMQQPLFAPTT